MDSLNIIAGWARSLWAIVRGMACRHPRGRLVAIEWDGTAVYECDTCGKHISKGVQ